MKRQKSLAELLFEDDRVLKEEDEDGGDDIFGDDDAGDDEGGDDEGGDEEGGDEEGGDEESDDEGGDDDAGGDDEGDDSGGDDEEDDKPQGPADDTIDGEVNNLLADFEAEAVASAEQDESLKSEASLKNMHKKPMSKLLFEGDEPVFDVSHFANNIARVIDNYQTLLDVEKMIFDKAKSFLEAKYGEMVAKEFEDVLASDHQLTFVTGAGSDSSADNESIVPVAAGAMTPA